MRFDNIVKQNNILLGKEDRDAFSRLRVSNPKVLFDSKHIYSLNSGHKGEEAWFYHLEGSGASVYNSTDSTVSLTVGTDSGAESCKQSFVYFPSQGGAAALIINAAVMGTGEPNLVKEIGYGDDENGLFFAQVDGVNGIMVRTNTSGSVVESFVSQSSWNIDTMDGSGGKQNPSGFTLDWTKAHSFLISFHWLGVGTVSFSLSINGFVLDVHKVLNSNTLTVPFIATASLPVRNKLENRGTTGQANVLKTISSTYISEGGEELKGNSFLCSNGVLLRTGISGRTPILAIRMKNTYQGKPNRVVCNILSFTSFVIVQTCYLELVNYHEPTTLSATWKDVDTDKSAVEFSTDISDISGGHEHKIKDMFVLAGGSGATSFSSVGSASVPDARDLAHFISQNHDADESRLFVVFATRISGNPASVSATLTWQEIY